MAATFALRIRSRSADVAIRWQRRQSVRMLFRSHSPPPSTTGTIWSASQRLFRIRVLKPQCAISSSRRVPRERFNERSAASVSTPQPQQRPLSRFNTCSRRYAGCDRSFHSCTQKSLQKVNRRFGTSSEHHRHMPRPFGPRGTLFRSTHPPTIVRAVLTSPF